MAKDLLDYDRMVDVALREVVRQALRSGYDGSLPGDHHFYITFRTAAAGVVIPDYLRERFEDEMTIVLQHQFWDLEVLEEQFSLTLSFNNQPENLVVPFDALTGFFDPSVQFGLQFQSAKRRLQDGDRGVQDEVQNKDGKTGSDPVADINNQIAAASEKTTAAKSESKDGTDAPTTGQDDTTGTVVTLDSFRKK